jgi:predicted nuclease of restriction endonuclease-like (RecB) superfamily
MISYEENELKREFYLELAAMHRWSSRELADQMDKMLFERTAIAAKPEEQITEAISQVQQGTTINPDLVFKNSYVLDFIKSRWSWSKSDAIVNSVKKLIDTFTRQGFVYFNYLSYFTIASPYSFRLSLYISRSRSVASRCKACCCP